MRELAGGQAGGNGALVKKQVMRLVDIHRAWNEGDKIEVRMQDQQDVREDYQIQGKNSAMGYDQKQDFCSTHLQW